MTAENFHKAMRPLEDACPLAKSGWVCLPNPLVGWGEEGMICWRLGVLLRHMGLVFRCLGHAASPHILIREFSTIPLLLVFPFLWMLRKKLFFMLHQNVQWAVERKSERAALVLLSKLGARWALLETQNFQGLEKFNIPSSRNLVLPHPVPEKFSRVWEKGDRPVIGVAGYYRPEKGMDELVRLLQKNFPTVGILLGVPNPEAAAHLDVEIVNTSTDEAYRKMISRCDVLIQNGAEKGYFYRASGPIADAAACGTAVVAPDYPVIRHQLSSPLPVGEIFQRLEKMPAAVQRAIENVRAKRYDFDTCSIARSAQALAKCLDSFSNG